MYVADAVHKGIHNNNTVIAITVLSHPQL